MKNCESALLIGLISIILIVMILIGKNNNMNNKKVEAAKNNLIENFQNSGETVESLRLRNQELENLEVEIYVLFKYHEEAFNQQLYQLHSYDIYS